MSVDAEPTLPKPSTTAFPSNGQLLAEETEELLTVSLTAMRANLQQTPAWSLAPPPTDEFLLMFLRTEVFSPSAAADRYRKFWKMKVLLCGEEKAPFPIKAEDAEAALKTEYIQLVPGSRDIEGRQVVLMNPGNMNTKIDKKLRAVAVWYVLLAALEDVETQRRGFCFLVNPKTVSIRQMDRKYMKLALESLQGALPLRIGSLSICYPPTFFRVAWAIISPFMHERVKKRVRVIPGTDEQVKNALGNIVTSDNLPPPMGQRPLDFSGWLEERARSEG
eukprot:g7877.t1